MPISVTVPIVSRPPTSRHAGGHSGGHAHSVAKPKLPAVPHVKAPPRPKAPHVPHIKAPPRPRAPHVSHARGSAASHPRGSTNLFPGSLQLSPGQTVSSPAAALEQLGSHLDTPAGVQAYNDAAAAFNQAAAGHPGDGLPTNTYTGRFNSQGLPAPSHARGGIKIKNIPHGPAVTYFTAHQRAVYAATGSLAATLAAAPGAAHSHSHTPHVAATHARKITAPLQLSDSGLQGHDSHLTPPPPLTPIAPVIRRRPH